MKHGVSTFIVQHTSCHEAVGRPLCAGSATLGFLVGFQKTRLPQFALLWVFFYLLRRAESYGGERYLPSSIRPTPRIRVAKNQPAVT